MAGIGDTGGRAIELGFPSYPGTDTVRRARGGAGRQGVPFAQQSGIDIDKMFPVPTGIQLDEAGIADQIYQNTLGLRQFLHTALQQGYDPTKGPIPGDPMSLEISRRWNGLTAQYWKNIEGAKQGLENQKFIMDAFRDGKILANQNAFDTSQGNTDFRNIMEDTYATDLPFIQDANKVLAREPVSPEEAQDQQLYYAQLLDEIDLFVREGNMSPESADYYKSQIARPRRFDKARFDMEAEESRSRVRKNDAAASASRARAKQLKNQDIFFDPRQLAMANAIEDGMKRAREGGDKEEESIFGSALSSLKQMFGVEPEKATATNREALNGTSLYGKGQYKGDRVRIDQDGNVVATFKRDESVTITEAEENEYASLLGGGDQIRRSGGGEIEIEFSKDNFLPFLQGIMSEAQYQNYVQDMLKGGAINVGEIPNAETALRQAGRTPQGEDPYSSLRGLSPRDFATTMKKQGLSNDQIKQLWAKINGK